MTDGAIVCVIDDDEAVRDSLDFLLGAAGFDVRLHASAEDFLSDIPAECGCVVTDVRMPGMDGVTLIQTLRQRGCTAPVIVMTGHGDVPLAVAAMKAGAADFLQKPYSDQAILDTVRTALGTETVNLSDAQKEARARLAQLSGREAQVLERLVNGDANKVIAQDLGLSPRTVEVYRANVMTKMQAGSFAELVRLAVYGGLEP